VNPLDLLVRIGHRLAALPTHTKILLTLATTVMVVELILRRVAPESRFYAGWKRVFETIGKFWTAVILSIIYFLSVSLVSLAMKALGKDPLDRQLAGEPSFWRTYEKNPLGPQAASRHQF
jgi:hypothetical protein